MGAGQSSHGGGRWFNPSRAHQSNQRFSGNPQSVNPGRICATAQIRGDPSPTHSPNCTKTFTRARRSSSIWRNSRTCISPNSDCSTTEPKRRERARWRRWSASLARRIEFDAGALKDLRGLDRQVAHRITQFLRERLAVMDDPRALGAPLRSYHDLPIDPAFFSIVSIVSPAHAQMNLPRRPWATTAVGIPRTGGDDPNLSRATSGSSPAGCPRRSGLPASAPRRGESPARSSC